MVLNKTSDSEFQIHFNDNDGFSDVAQDGTILDEWKLLIRVCKRLNFVSVCVCVCAFTCLCVWVCVYLCVYFLEL